MKLTKGKLSKIRNKKNQSAKRVKNHGKIRNAKTFRKRRALNLHKKSLKKYRGGQPDEQMSPKSDAKENVIESSKVADVVSSESSQQQDEAGTIGASEPTQQKNVADSGEGNPQSDDNLKPEDDDLNAETSSQAEVKPEGQEESKQYEKTEDSVNVEETSPSTEIKNNDDEIPLPEPVSQTGENDEKESTEGSEIDAQSVENDASSVISNPGDEETQQNEDDESTKTSSAETGAATTTIDSTSNIPTTPQVNPSGPALEAAQGLEKFVKFLANELKGANNNNTVSLNPDAFSAVETATAALSK